MANRKKEDKSPKTIKLDNIELGKGSELREELKEAGALYDSPAKKKEYATFTGKHTSATVYIDDIDEGLSKQVHEMLNQEPYTNPIAIMPDGHPGNSATIGFTMELEDKIIPYTIGVDIGCGMMSTKLNVTKFGHRGVDENIRRKIPMGFSVNPQRKCNIALDWNWTELNKEIHDFTTKFNERMKTNYLPGRVSITTIKDICGKTKYNFDRVEKSIGTLGGGNHFIEFGKSEKDGSIWLTIHTGSRGFGKAIADYWQAQARLDMEQAGIKTSQPRYLEGEHMYQYLRDTIIAQYYSKMNRKVIVDRILKTFGWKAVEQIETIHNYIDPRDFIIRKGAIASYKNEKMIIPFNMRDGMIIATGKSNKEWNYSAPHGAGRVLSRAQAKKTVSMDDFKNSMRGIYSNSVNVKTIDESPMAYKDAKVIEMAIEPTAVIIDKIKPIHNIKSNL